MTCVLALDVGTTAVKAAVVSLDGGVEVRSIAEAPLELVTPAPGWAEQDPASWWQAVVAAVAALPADERRRIEAVTVTGQMQDLICVDAALVPVRPTILYSDVRATAEHAALLDELGDAWARAVGTTPDATAAALPPLEPPGVRVTS